MSVTGTYPKKPILTAAAFVAAGFIAFLSSGSGRLRAAPPQPSQTSAGAERALLDEYCVVCHNQQIKTAGLMLDKMDLIAHPRRRRDVGKGHP